MSKRSRAKGKSGELEFAQFCRDHGFADVRRGRQFRGGPDSPDVANIPGVHAEVKRTEAFRLWDAVEQAEAEAPDGALPVVFHRKNRRKWVAVLDAAAFLGMLEARDG